ncbi:MAG: hypothetical protein EHM61_25930, partial [Acidobacteria bacterium]
PAYFSPPLRYRGTWTKSRGKGERGKGAKGQRGKGAKGKGRGAKGRRGGGKKGKAQRRLSDSPFFRRVVSKPRACAFPSSPLPLCPFAPLPLCPSAPLPLLLRKTPPRSPDLYIIPQWKYPKLLLSMTFF